MRKTLREAHAEWVRIHLWARFGWGLMMVLALVGLAALLGNLLVPVALAFFAAYVLDPVIDRIEARGINRSLAIVLFLGGVALLLGLFAFLMVPVIGSQTHDFSTNLPGYVGRFQQFLIQHFGPLLERVWGKKVPHSYEEMMRDLPVYLKQMWPSVMDSAQQTLATVVSSTRYLLTMLFTLVLLPVFTFYFLRDFDRFKLMVAELFPRRTQSYWVSYFQEIDRELASVIRGQILVCVILGTLYAVGLSIIGLPLGVLIGLLTGLLAFIPYVGFAVGFMVALLMSLMAWQGPGLFMGVLVTYGVVQALDAVAITPRILGDRLRVSPVVIIIALFVGGRIGGFVGVLIAVPVTAILKVVIRHLIMGYRHSSLYTGTPHEDPPTPDPRRPPTPPEEPRLPPRRVLRPEDGPPWRTPRNTPPTWWSPTSTCRTWRTTTTSGSSTSIPASA